MAATDKNYSCWDHIDSDKLGFKSWTRMTANDYIERHFSTIMTTMDQDVVSEEEQKQLRGRGDYPFMRDEKKKNPFYVLTFSSKEIANDLLMVISWQ